VSTKPEVILLSRNYSWVVEWSWPGLRWVFSGASFREPTLEEKVRLPSHPGRPKGVDRTAWSIEVLRQHGWEAEATEAALLLLNNSL